MVAMKKKSRAGSKAQKPLTPDEVVAGLRKIGGAAMGDRLVDAYGELESYKDQMAEAPLTFYWHFGQACKELVCEEAAQAAEAGKVSRPIGAKALARYLKVDRSKIKDAGYVYEAFPTKAALEDLRALRKADGTSLGFIAIARLCQPGLAAGRDALIKRACAGNMTELQIKDMLAAERGVDARANKGGRAPKPPRTLVMALQKWKRDAEEQVRYATAVFREDVLKDLMISADVTFVTPAHVQDVRATVEALADAVIRELAMLDSIEAALKPAAAAAARPTLVAQAPVAEVDAEVDAEEEAGEEEEVEAPVLVAVAPKAPAAAPKETSEERVKRMIKAGRAFQKNPVAQPSPTA